MVARRTIPTNHALPPQPLMDLSIGNSIKTDQQDESGSKLGEPLVDPNYPLALFLGFGLLGPKTTFTCGSTKRHQNPSPWFAASLRNAPSNESPT